MAVKNLPPPAVEEVSFYRLLRVLFIVWITCYKSSHYTLSIELHARNLGYSFVIHLFVIHSHGPVLFCLLASVVCRRLSSVTLPAGGPGAWTVGWPTLHGGPERLRPVRATPCLFNEKQVHEAYQYHGTNLYCLVTETHGVNNLSKVVT